MRELENGGYTKSEVWTIFVFTAMKGRRLITWHTLTLLIAEMCTAVVQYQCCRDYSPTFDVNIVVSTRGISVFGFSVVQDAA